MAAAEISSLLPQLNYPQLHRYLHILTSSQARGYLRQADRVDSFEPFLTGPVDPDKVPLYASLGYYIPLNTREVACFSCGFRFELRWLKSLVNGRRVSVPGAPTRPHCPLQGLRLAAASQSQDSGPIPMYEELTSHTGQRLLSRQNLADIVNYFNRPGVGELTATFPKDAILLCLAERLVTNDSLLRTSPQDIFQQMLPDLLLENRLRRYPSLSNPPSSLLADEVSLLVRQAPPPSVSLFDMISRQAFEAAD